MRGTHRGFTLIEIVIALLIGGILTSIAMSQYGNAQARFAVRGARNTFVSTVARVRAGAIEFGTTHQLIVDLAADSVAVVRNDTVLDAVNYLSQFNVDLRSSNTRLVLCMTPRGYADDSCNSFTTKQTVTFWFNADSTAVTILPLGQVILN